MYIESKEDNLFKYERIVDELYYLGNYVMLKFNVDLGKKDKDGMRQLFHSEFNYNSNKYANINRLTTLRRSFDFYLTLEMLKSVDGFKEYIQIRVQDILYVRMMLEDAVNWFFRPEYSELYRMHEGKIYLNKVLPDRNTTGIISMGKYLEMEPVVLNIDGKDDMGVRLYLSSDNVFVDLTVSKLMGLKYLIDSINMYESAQLMINYIPQIPYGTNAIVFEDDFSEEPEGGVRTKVNNRSIPAEKKQNKSFFAEVDKL